MTTQLEGSNQNQPIFISTPTEYDNLKYHTIFSFICINCNKKETLKKADNKSSQSSQRTLLCRTCRRQTTCLKRHGATNPAQVEEFKNKMKQTCISRYGFENPAQCEAIKSKMKQTCIQTYGVVHPSQCQEVKDKIKKTTIEHYGCSCSLQAPEVKEKSKQTCINKYGFENPMSNPDVLNKRNETNQKKYGGNIPFADSTVMSKRNETMIKLHGSIHALKDEDSKSKFIKTCNDRYNTDYPAQNKDIIKKQQTTNKKRYGVVCTLQLDSVRAKTKKTNMDRYGSEVPHHNYIYVYNNEKFDSYWELCFYVYHVDNRIKIIREPKPLQYIYNDTVHYYYPDFEVDNKLYEIKGDQFFKDDNTMQCPFDHSQDELYEAKHKCGIDNNVIFIRKNEIKPYLDYVDSTYGKSFKKGCKVAN